LGYSPELPLAIGSYAILSISASLLNRWSTLTVVGDIRFWSRAVFVFRVKKRWAYLYRKVRPGTRRFVGVQRGLPWKKGPLARPFLNLLSAAQKGREKLLCAAG
jgi:hypothetical protein